MAQSKNGKKGEKKTFIPEKRIKPKKETIMILLSKAEIIDNKVDGKEILAFKTWYGKQYLVLKNI